MPQTGSSTMDVIRQFPLLSLSRAFVDGLSANRLTMG